MNKQQLLFIFFVSLVSLAILTVLVVSIPAWTHVSPETLNDCTREIVGNCTIIR